MSATYNDANHDTTHVDHPSLDSSSTFTGTLNNHIDPVFGPTTDFDYFEIDIAGGPNDGPGSIAPNADLTITFEPGSAYFFRVGARVTTYDDLHSTTAYQGSTATLLRHEPSVVDGPNTFTWNLLQATLSFRLAHPGVLPEVIEFEIVGGSAPSGGLPYGPLSYAITLNGGGVPGGTTYNGHSYSFVGFNGAALSWSQARDAAIAMGGYLATITSQGENNFILNNIAAGHLTNGANAAFIGASDAGHEGVWQWATGPEAGTTFWNGESNGTVVSGQYANWNAGEPSNATNNADGSENFAVMEGNGSWNDVPSVRSADITVGYIVEFSNSQPNKLDDSITKLYVGYYNRAPDPGGETYWVGQLQGGMSLSAIAQSYSVQTESTTLYPFLASPNTASTAAVKTFVDSIYTNLFNRQPDSGGEAYWISQLQSGASTVGGAIINIISGAQGNDLLTINNKVTVGDYFDTQIFSHNVLFSGTVALAALHAVTFSASSIATAEAIVDAYVLTAPHAALPATASQTEVQVIGTSPSYDLAIAA